MKKVFEDKTQGIICYTDDNGEVICEGYDEGPRCPTQSPMVASYSRYDKIPNPYNQIDLVSMFLIIGFGPKKKKNRELEILDLLQRSYQELSGAEKDGQKQMIASQQEFKMIKWSSFDFL